MSRLFSVIHGQHGLGIAVCLCRWIAIRTGATAAKMSKKLDASTAYVSECDEHDFQPFVIHPWLKRFRCRRWCTDRIAQVRKRLRQG